MKKSITYLEQPVSYQISGTGSCLFLLHGFCEDHTVWDNFRTRFDAQFTVICPDIPGFGDSPTCEGFRVEMMAAIANHILEAEGIESCYFVGHSMGGYVALAFAEKYAPKLKGLCLFHSQPFADTEEKQQNRRKTIDFMEKWGVAPFVKELIPKLFSAKFIEENDVFIYEFIAKAALYPKEGLIEATHAMIHRPDRSQVLADLDCPVLFIIGGLDEAIPKEASEAQIHLPKSATAIVLNEVAHMGMIEAEEETIGILEGWLNT